MASFQFESSHPPCTFQVCSQRVELRLAHEVSVSAENLKQVPLAVGPERRTRTDPGIAVLVLLRHLSRKGRTRRSRLCTGCFPWAFCITAVHALLLSTILMKFSKMSIFFRYNFGNTFTKFSPFGKSCWLSFRSVTPLLKAPANETPSGPHSLIWQCFICYANSRARDKSNVGHKFVARRFVCEGTFALFCVRGKPGKTRLP